MSHLLPFLSRSHASSVAPRILAWTLAAGFGLATSQAQNLLDKVPVLLTTNPSADTKDWTPRVTFDKKGEVPVRVRAEFTLKELPATPVLSLKKPDHISEWTLNGKPVIAPPKDAFYPQLEGIPAADLKVGANVLEGRFAQRVDLRDGKIAPESVGDYRMDLQPADPKSFDIRTGPVLGAAGYDYFTVGCRTRWPAVVTLHCDGRTWTSKPGLIHLLRANGLKEGKEYEYTLVAKWTGGEISATSMVSKVKTLSSKGPWTFVAMGDARHNPKIWGKLTQEMLKFKPDFAMHTGDITGNGNDYDGWDLQFSRPGAEFISRIPCFYTYGNHENNVSMLDLLFGYPGTNRNYNARIGSIQIFGMDRFENWGKGSPNLVQMEKELAASDAKFIFAFSHVPAWSSGSHGNDTLGKDIHFPIFDKYGVTAAIAGHDHCYERSEPPGGTTMLIAGGAGATLYRSEHAKDNPYSKIYKSEYGFLVFTVDGDRCEMKAYTYGAEKTPDDQRKLELVDTRVWEARKVPAGSK